MTPEEMDDYAIEAANALPNVDPDSVDAISKWVEKWYRTDGHKHLGGILLSYEAAKDLIATVEKEKVDKVAEWWRANIKAGHKNLSKIIIGKF